ncbi:PAS domain-containing protein [Sutterella wadsworthensis]
MKLLAAFSGPNCEVVLHDLSDPVHSVVRVENGEVTGRAVGQGLRHLVPNLLRMSRTDDGALSSESPNLLPVYWLRSRGRLIRALSLLIRDDAGEVIGVLCINQDVTNVSAAAGQLQALLALLPPGEASILPEASASADALASEHAAAQLASAVSRDTEAKDLQKDADIELEGSVLKTVYAMIDRMTERVRAGRSSSAVLTREERLPLVRFMDTCGVFLVKGALDYAAERLGVSKVTLYSDLDLLRRESESAGSLA